MSLAAGTALQFVPGSCGDTRLELTSRDEPALVQVSQPCSNMAISPVVARTFQTVRLAQYMLSSVLDLIGRLIAGAPFSFWFCLAD